MKDKSQSGFEFQLAKRLLAVGATDEEVVTAYRVWCCVNKLKVRKKFATSVLPYARRETEDYITAWKAKQPVRRKHGTTKEMIIEAIKAGAKKPREIVQVTGLSGNVVRAQLKRLVDAEKLVRTSSGYAIADVYSPASEPEAA